MIFFLTSFSWAILSLNTSPALNLPLLASSPSFFLLFITPLSSVPLSPEYLLSFSLISNAGVIFRSHWKTRTGTQLPSLCGFNGFVKYTVSMSNGRNSKLYSSHVILKPSSSTKAVSSGQLSRCWSFFHFWLSQQHLCFYITVVLTYSLEHMLSITYKFLMGFTYVDQVWCVTSHTLCCSKQIPHNCFYSISAAPRGFQHVLMSPL